MKVTLLCFSLLAVFTVCLSIPSTFLGDNWFSVFNPPVRNFVANFAASAQQGMGSWSGTILSVMGKNWATMPGPLFRPRHFRVLYIGMPWRRLCRAFVFWGFGAPSLLKSFGADRHMEGVNAFPKTFYHGSTKFFKISQLDEVDFFSF